MLIIMTVTQTQGTKWAIRMDGAREREGWATYAPTDWSLPCNIRPIVWHVAGQLWLAGWLAGSLGCMRARDLCLLVMLKQSYIYLSSPNLISIYLLYWTRLDKTTPTSVIIVITMANMSTQDESKRHLAKPYISLLAMGILIAFGRLEDYRFAILVVLHHSRGSRCLAGLSLLIASLGFA